jgi:hypothetical protein
MSEGPPREVVVGPATAAVPAGTWPTAAGTSSPEALPVRITWQEGLPVDGAPIPVAPREADAAPVDSTSTPRPDLRVAALVGGASGAPGESPRIEVHDRAVQLVQPDGDHVVLTTLPSPTWRHPGSTPSPPQLHRPERVVTGLLRIVATPFTVAIDVGICAVGAVALAVAFPLLPLLLSRIPFRMC